MQSNSRQIKPTVRAHFIRGAFYLLSLLAVCVTPFAMGQRTTDSSRPGGDEVLWNQYGNAATEPPIGIGSQDFESAFDVLDDQAADDFVLTFPFNNCITRVRVMGEYSAGGGPASSFNVYFYFNGAGNLPGNLFSEYLNLPYTGTPPDLEIMLPFP